LSSFNHLSIGTYGLRSKSDDENEKLNLFFVQIVQSTFYTWYRLSELLQSFNDDRLIDKVKPYLEKVLDILCGQCKLDSDHVKILLFCEIQQGNVVFV